jgi:hypothetical protein
LFIEGVCAAILALEGDRSLDGIPQVDLPIDHVLPGRRICILEVSHKYVSSRVESINHHLPVCRPGDFHPAFLQVWRGRGNLPGGIITDGPGRDGEIGKDTGVDLSLAIIAQRQELPSALSELPLQTGHKGGRLGGEDFGHTRGNRS